MRSEGPKESESARMGVRLAREDRAPPTVGDEVISLLVLRRRGLLRLFSCNGSGVDFDELDIRAQSGKGESPEVVDIGSESLRNGHVDGRVSQEPAIRQEDDDGVDYAELARTSRNVSLSESKSHCACSST